MFTFGDIDKSQYLNAKPILDQYGFKGSFFVTCDWVGDKSRMSWQDIETLHNQGHDIESKTMTHRDMNHLSLDELNFEVANQNNV